VPSSRRPASGRASGPVGVIVVAGGAGKRMGGRLRKPYLSLAGRPMLVRTLEPFERSRAIDGIWIAARKEDLTRCRRLVRRFGFRKVAGIVAGGGSRSESVFNGLKAVSPAAKWILVHDAARPLVTIAVIERTLAAARRHGAAVAAVPVVPTIKEARAAARNGAAPRIRRTLDRRRLWEIQTPQAFRAELLRRAYACGARARARATDDASLVERMKRPVHLALGSPWNIKVTRPEDRIIAEAVWHANRNWV